MTMDIHVYDTYVKAKDGHTMHFDVITNVQDHDKAIEYAKQWLATVGEEGAKVTGEECRNQRKGILHSKNGRMPINYFFNLQSWNYSNKCSNENYSYCIK